MRQIFLIPTLVLSMVASADAQTAVENLPPGRRTAGWAVEYLEQPPRSLDDMELAMGESVQSVTGPLSLRTSNASAKQSMGVVGRGFFASQYTGRYLFAIQFSGLNRYDRCNYRLTVGGSEAVSGSFLVTQNEFNTSRTFSGVVDLTPGYYRTALFLLCEASLRWRGTAAATIKIRDDSSASLHAPNINELFHVTR